MEIRTRLVNYMKKLGDKDLCVASVSYTHLTLPTILRV